MNQCKLTDLTVENIFFTAESVKRQITDSISTNLTDSDLESTKKETTSLSCLPNSWKASQILKPS